MSSELFEEFKSYFPNLYDKAEEMYERGPFEVIAKLDDGRIVSFYILDKTVRRLPNDILSMNEDECRKEFGITLERIMYRKGVTQEELSKRTGITQAMLSRYITGKASPTFYKVDKIAKALECSIDDLRIIY